MCPRLPLNAGRLASSIEFLPSARANPDIPAAFMPAALRLTFLAFCVVFYALASSGEGRAAVGTVTQRGADGALWALTGEQTVIPGNTYTYTMTPVSGVSHDPVFGFSLSSSEIHRDAEMFDLLRSHGCWTLFCLDAYTGTHTEYLNGPEVSSGFQAAYAQNTGGITFHQLGVGVVTKATVKLFVNAWPRPTVRTGAEIVFSAFGGGGYRNMGRRPSSGGLVITVANVAPDYLGPFSVGVYENWYDGGYGYYRSRNHYLVMSKFRASDANGDSLTYALSGPGAERFLVDSNSRLKIAHGTFLDHEAKANYALKVTVTDGNGGSDTGDLNIRVFDSDHPPGVPGTPTLLPVPGSPRSLDARWGRAAHNMGSLDPDMESRRHAAYMDAIDALFVYELQYRKRGSDGWTDAPQVTVTSFDAFWKPDASATITGLEAGTTYEFRVRAVNVEGDGEWSGTGTGSTAPRSNTLAQGRPTISGEPHVWLTLAASTSGITDADGLSGVSYSYQWIRVDESTGVAVETDIVGAMRSTLKVLEEGKKFKVRVSFTDDRGDSETLTSVATAQARDLYPPASFDVQPDHGEVVLTWQPPAIDRGEPILRYKYCYFLARKKSSSKVCRHTDGAALTATVSGLLNDRWHHWYQFNVQAVDRLGNGMSRGYVVALPPAVSRSPQAVAFTARFAGLPESHNGASGFSFELHFSENVPGLSDEKVGGGLLDVSGARVTGARRLERGSNRRWAVNVTPGQGGDVVIALSARACDEALAVCVGGRALSATVSATVPAMASGLASDASFRAAFERVPAEHDGRTVFAFELAFSEGVAGLSYMTLRDSAFRVTNGRVTGARRLEPGKNRRWRLTVRPAGTEDVQIELPITTDCRAAGAICSGGQPLSASLAAMVLGPPVAPPLTAEFRVAPGEHDGRTAFSFELHFSEDIPGLSYKTLRDHAFIVTNGRITGARRFAQGSNRSWVVNVQPNAPKTVTVRLPVTSDCAGRGAICLPGGRKLSGALAVTVLGPPSARVADARAEEGTDDTLDFVVTLARAPGKAVTVVFATSDGTATAGTDYTHSTGRLTFAPGETAKTVSVPVLDDAIDEGEETMRLTLWYPTSLPLDHAVAVGTISNRDPLQKMWLSRFGRTAAGHVVDAVSDRLSDPLAGAQATVGGQRIDLARVSDEVGVAEVIAGLARALGAGGGPEPEAGPEGWPETRGAWGGPASAGASARSLSGHELLLGSTFHLSHDGDGGRPGLAAWGRVTTGGFDAEAPAERGRMRIDGEVTTGIVGTDAAWNRWLAGVAVSVSEGESTFEQPGVDSGTVESRLTSVQPYARLQMSERLSAWGLVGYGGGDMTIRQAASEGRGEIVTRTDLGMRLGAMGARGALLTADENGGIDLALKADAFMVRMESEKAANTVATTTGASRLRLTLEGSRAFEVGEGAVLEPGLEFGLRHDGGDAETGTGVEFGGRIRYADTASGLSVEARVRTLIAHAASGFEEWGASGSIRLDPGASGRGLSFSLAPTLGAASSGTEWLWSMEDARGLGARDDGFEPQARLNAEVGYGLGLGGGLFTSTPYAGLGLSESGRDWRLGWRLGSVRREALDFEFDLEGTRSESAGGDAPPVLGLMLRGALRW